MTTPTARMSDAKIWALLAAYHGEDTGCGRTRSPRYAAPASSSTEAEATAAATSPPKPAPHGSKTTPTKSADSETPDPRKPP